MYESYWRLKEKPFENTPDPKFIYYSQNHEEALSRMIYAIRERKGAAILTGEYGSGKTLLSRVLFEELSREWYTTALIFNPILPPLDLIREIIYQLGGNIDNLLTKADLLRGLNEILISNHQEGKNTVILIDEAQAINEESSFEELRLFLNFQLDDAFLLTLILMGQPDLKEKINKLPQLKQRLQIRYHLKALTEEQTGEYVRHRLEVAGAHGAVFNEDSYIEIYRYSGGIPRRINNLCDMALLVGCGEGLDAVTKDVILDVAQDMGEEPIDIAPREKAGAHG